MNRKERPNLLFAPAFRMAFLLCLFLILALFAPVTARGAEAAATNAAPDLSEMSLEALMNVDVPVVYSASKFEQKATEAPSQVTVITSDDIKRYGYRTLADILRSVPGFDVTYDRDHAYLGVGGVNLGDFNSRILLMVNGHRVNNNLTDGAYIDTAFILDVDLIDRVEIVRGPGSVLYGNNAFFGVINVITRRGKQLNGAEVSGEYGTFDTYKARATYGKEFANGLEFLLSGTYYDSAGPDQLFYPGFDTPAQDNGIARNIDGDSYGSVFASVGYQDLTLEGGFIHRDKDNPTAQFFTTFDDPRLRTVDDRGYVTLKYDHKFSDTWDLSANVYYDQSDTQIGYPIGSAGGPAPAPFFYEEQQTGEWAGGEVQLNKRMWDRNLFTIGGEFRDDFKQDDHFYEIEPASASTSDLRDHRQNFGVFAQDDLTVVTNLHLNAGVRFDQSYDPRDDFSPSWSPRVAVIYEPGPQSTLKFIYGTAFRDPSFYEISEAASSSSSISPPQPESITSYEVDYEQGFGSHWRGSVSGFYNKLDNLIVFDSGIFTNLNVNAAGGELAIEGHWTNGPDCRLSYTLQGTRDRTGNLELPDSPDNLVKLNINVPLVPEKLFAGLELQYTSQRHSWQYAGNPPIPGNGPSDVGGYAVVNFTLFSQNLVKNLDVSASVYNLFDTHDSDPASQLHFQEAIPQDGRTLRIKLTYRF